MGCNLTAHVSAAAAMGEIQRRRGYFDGGHLHRVKSSHSHGLVPFKCRACGLLARRPKGAFAWKGT
jgi:hypothetical protein